MLRFAILLLLLLLPTLTYAKTPIFGKAEVEVDHMYAYVSRHNPDFDRKIAEAFYRVGERYGIRGDIALCQAIIETGWFRFDNGTAVKAKSHNYCGLGVKKRGDKGCSFSNVEEGVTAMIQHLYAYACAKQLPDGEKIVDPRFSFVNRGCAKTWEKLAGRWAMNPRYGKNILKIYDGLHSHAKSGKKVNFIEVEIPDELFDNPGSDDLDFQHDVKPDVEVANNQLFE